MSIGRTSVTWANGRPVVTFPIPGVPTATATATLDGRFMAEHVVVENGADTYEFSYSDYRDWNNPLHPAEAFFAGTVFLLSANALLFTPHAVEEMQATFSRLVSYQPASSENSHPADHDHAHADEGAQGGGAAHRDCCSAHAPHSHDVANVPVPVLNSPVSVCFVTFLEPSAYVPEVFLDRFVPPQNLT
jgi:hypothetical protein